MKIRNKPIFFACIAYLTISIICITCIWFFFFHSEKKTPVLRGVVDTISLYAHDVWFPDGEFQKKEITARADIEAITDELVSVQYQNHIFPPDDLGGGWMMTIELHYHNGDKESYKILFDGSEQVVVYPPSGRSVYGIWPAGGTLWNRVDVPAEVITEEEMPEQ